ncbi:MAG: EVE domain-containing protein [Rhodospirillaceae bacterium]|nr:EVE domain-containing protein [Rhodospirillaceae bacterium]
MKRHWIAVACADHVRIGRAAGFMQVCHGKAAPLRRLDAGDLVVYYSPGETMTGPRNLRAFTALGVVAAGPAYRAETGGGFHPFRRDISWLAARETPIRPLLKRLAFTAAKRNWGYQLRFGLVEIAAGDMALIADAMAATLPVPPAASSAT